MKRGFFRVRILFAIVAGFFVLSGLGFIGIWQYQSYQIKKDDQIDGIKKTQAARREKEMDDRVSKEKVIDNHIASPSAIELVPNTITFKDGSSVTFSLSSKFNLALASEDIGKARFIAMSPDGRMFVPDMIDWNLSKEGRIIILDDFDSETHKFKSRSTYLSGLRGPNSIAFYKDRDGKEWIYIALTEKLIRFPYNAGDSVPSSNEEVIAYFPFNSTLTSDSYPSALNNSPKKVSNGYPDGPRSRIALRRA